MFMNKINKKEDISTNEEWHLLDANNQVLGRVAVKAAALLLAKHRTDFAKNNVAPVKVVIINTDRVALTGKKEEQKKYYRYSGYPGGMRERTVKDQRARDSRKILEFAISGMLPKNNLRKLRMRNLKLYKNDQHPHSAQEFLIDKL